MADNQSKIVPRWEWRTFAPSLGPLRSKLPRLAGEPRISSEIYLVKSRSQNVKLRDDQIDIKRLEDVDANGFELWEPMFKAKFPLSSADVARLFEEWGAERPSIKRDSLSLDLFLEEVITPIQGIRIVRVGKSRRAFELGGCIAELAEVSFEGRRLETFSIESEDTHKMIAALASVGLSSSRNISYPVCLKQELGLV